MKEIAPGVFHWKALHPSIRTEVSSYLLADSGTLLDPMVPPDEGLEWFDDHRPERIVLTNRHHYRDSGRYRERFDLPVLCNEVGLHEFEGGPQVDGFSIGDEVAPGVTAHEFGAICPDDTALHVAQGSGFVAFADSLIRYGELGFVPDEHMDDPAQVKRDTYAMARDLLELDFDGLLFAHGDPQASGGKAMLREFADSGAG
jgi:glyoxylase-like metal-dependent hydrolase (beta-lactamase superfamily II)